MDDQVYLAFIFDKQFADVCVWSRGWTPTAAWLLHWHHFTLLIPSQIWQFYSNLTGFQSSMFHTAATLTCAPIWKLCGAMNKPKCVWSRTVGFVLFFLRSLVVRFVCRPGLTGRHLKPSGLPPAPTKPLRLRLSSRLEDNWWVVKCSCHKAKSPPPSRSFVCNYGEVVCL